MKKTTTLILIGGAAALLAGLSIAQNSKNQSHLVDTYGTRITTRSETEVCVRTSDWTPARAGASCDPIVENGGSTAIHDGSRSPATPETRNGAGTSITTGRAGKPTIANTPHMEPF